MKIQKTLGGDRLGSGRKMTQELHGFGRSSHNVSKITRTDQAIGTIVPVWCQIGTTGTTFYVNLEAKTRTLPTNGPIFASMKHQIDVFVVPMRLYIGALHNNMLGIGLNMSEVKMPQFSIQAQSPMPSLEDHTNWQQISQDSLLAYLGVRGVGQSPLPAVEYSTVRRNFNGMFLLAYWDIYKNYYANKQEGIGYVIGGSYATAPILRVASNAGAVIADGASGKWKAATTLRSSSGEISAVKLDIKVQTANSKDEAWDQVRNSIVLYKATNSVTDIYTWTRNDWSETWNGNTKMYYLTPVAKTGSNIGIATANNQPSQEVKRDGIKINQFGLEQIDSARTTILGKAAEYNVPLDMNSEIPQEPYKYTYGSAVNKNKGATKSITGNESWFNQAGLGLRTYLSDRFNNWLSTEWIDGTNGINEVTAIQIVDNKLSMDALIMQKKVFDMLNRVAISGGSYNDWQEAVYGVRVARMAESPIYMGGASYEIVFSEVVSNSSTEKEPLGTLAGRGVETNKKGGRSLRIKCEEPSLIIALSSYVPRIDYSQGNKWWTRLESMDDLHKPNLDAIGFQELITDEFCALDTKAGSPTNVIYKSIGKQVSWQEYMTEVNETYGDFAVGGELDWMAFNRIYDYEVQDATNGGVTNATTYIDPTAFNVAFADARLSAKNLWSQIAINATARRVMSAKQIPNL